MVAGRDGVQSVRDIENSDGIIGAKISSTFRGRDIFSPGISIRGGELPSP
jgi:S-adenosylmethionine hydrolase